MIKYLAIMYVGFLGLGGVLFTLVSLIAFHPEWLLVGHHWVSGWQRISYLFLFGLVLCGPMLLAAWADEQKARLAQEKR